MYEPCLAASHGVMVAGPHYLLHLTAQHSFRRTEDLRERLVKPTRVSLHLCSLLLVLVTAQHIAAAAAAATCSLSIRGAGPSATAVTEARIQCRGGPVHIVADKELLGSFVDQWSGVTATAAECTMKPCQCLLTFHKNSKVTVQDAVVQDMYYSFKEGDRTLPSALLCITGDSQVTFNGARIIDNEATAIRVQGKAQVHLDKCLIARNTQGFGGSPGGGLSAMGKGTVITVHNSEFNNNNCSSGCGINTVDGQLEIKNSKFIGHASATVGAGAFFDRTNVTIIDTIFEANSAGSDGGGFAAVETSLALESVKLINNRARGSGGGAYFAALYDDTYATDLKVQGNRAQYGAGICINGSDPTVHISSSRFAKNVADLFGGAIMVSGPATLSLSGSVLEANTAGKYRVGTGGGVMMNTEGTIRIRDTVIARNRATRHGGGIRILTDEFDFEELQAAAVGRHNAALYEGAEDLSFAPRKISIVDHNANDGFVPELRALLAVNISVTGPQGKPTAGEDVEASMEADGQSVQLDKIATASDRDGIAHLKFHFNKNPGRYVVSFSVPSDPDVPQVSLEVEVLPCQRGYVTVERTPYTCQLCKPGTYSFDPSNDTCQQCPNQATCSGGAELRPLPQHWHSHPLSAQVHRCLNPQACMPEPRAIVDKTDVEAYKRSQCAEGHEGNLCGVCWRGWAKVRTLKCKQCQDAAVIIVMYSLAAVAVLLSMKLVLHFSNRDTQLLSHRQLMPTQASMLGLAAAQAVLQAQNSMCPPSQQSRLNRVGSNATTAPLTLQMSSSAGMLPVTHSVGTPFGRPSVQYNSNNAGIGVPQPTQGTAAAAQAADPEPDLSPTDVAKPFILYLQYLVLVASMPVKWPVTLYWPFELLNWFWATASSHVLSVECLLQARTGLPVSMQKLLFDLSMPLVLLLVLLLVEASLHSLWKCRRHHRGPVLPPGQTVRAVIIAMFFFTPFYVRTVLHMFACVPLDEQRPEPEQPEAVGRWWVGDMNQHCGEGYHKVWSLALGLPLALLFCAALPAALATFTWHHRQRLDEPAFQQRFSFLTRSYKASRCWWEAIVVVETVLLCLCTAYAAILGTYFQTLLMMAAFAVMFVLVLVMQPHQHTTVGRVALQGYGTLFVTAYCVLTLLKQPEDGLGPGHAPHPAYGWFIGVAVLVGNLLHIGYCIWQLAMAFDWSRVRSAAQQWLSRCCMRLCRRGGIRTFPSV